MGPPAANQGTTNTEALTTPILSLATPNMFSSLPPLFSSFMGDFPFGQLGQIPGGASAGGSTAVATGGNPGGGGGGDGSSAALVAFPVSIQPSASGAGMGNLVLQAQNMGQPFLLTPTYDRSANPLANSQGPPPSSLATGSSVNPNMMKDLEQLKQQYERTTQLIQQQLLLSQMSMMHQHQHQSQQQQSQHQTGGEGEGAEGTGGDGGTSQVSIGGGEGSALAGGGVQVAGQGVTGGGGGTTGGQVVVGDRRDSGLGSRESEAEVQAANQYINGSDVMIGSRSQSDSLLRRTREVGDLDGEELASKRPRLDTSVSAL